MKPTSTLFTALLVAVISAGCAGPRPPKPVNKVVVLVDGSASYKQRMNAAIQRAVEFLDQLAASKVHRWDKATTEVAIVSLDAMPAVLWHGSLRDLKATPRNSWTARFRSRSDYARCTDVNAAFQLAGQQLEGDPSYVQKYILAFTDLLSEPPAADIANCQAPKSVPDDFPWDTVADASVSVFWVPAKQILPWKQAIAQQGLDSSFQLYSDSESTEVEIAPPPRATVTLTDEQKAEQRQHTTDLLTKAGYGVAGFVVLLFIAGFIMSKLSSRQPAVAQRSVR
jgi:hypothetical protein